MDIVGGQFNHLIPSDQLDDSLLLGQNLECEASDDFESSPGQSKDSLKNMLSDKDPMFGSASSQFHLLENQDVNFKLANLTGPSDGENGPADTAEGRKPVTRFQRKQTASRGRPKGRRPGPGRRFASEDQESPSKHTELETSVNEKREALLHRRFKAHEVDSSMNPVVVLRRLTVTVGGYKIELLPGPSQTFGSFNTNDLEALGFQEDPVSLHVEKPSENMQGVDNSVQEVVEVSSDKPTNENIPMDFGPYVNPNEVQEPKNTLLFKPSVEKPAEDQIKKPSVQKPQKKNGTAAPPAVKKLLKRKPSPPGGKNKPLNRPALAQKPSSHARDDKTKPLRPENQATAVKKPSLKRPAGPLSPKSPSKLPKAPDGPTVPVSVFYPVSKKPSDSSPVKIQSPNSHKRPHNPPTPTSKTPPPVSNSQGSEKKPEKILQKQRSRSSRSVSVEEPQLFVPDNAPVVKKDAENEAPESDAVWDPSKHCGLCKKPHGNRFMVGCGRCDDWFHGDCVGLDLTKVQQMEKEDQEYVCLKCCADEEDRSAGQSTETPDEKTKTKPKPQPSLTSGGIRPFRKDARERRSTDDSAPRSGSIVKHESKKVKVSHVSSKQPSTGQIRRSVRDSLEEILLKRLKESSLKISTDKPAELARRTEKELFALFQGVDSKYKNKYRSLTFNLKDSKNNVLFKRVLKGEVSPTDLVRMTAEELASKELAAWRQRENRHTIEMIEKEQRDVDRRPITKITHKGEIEIENQEPAKAPETMEVEPEPKTKATEVAEENPPESKADSPKKSVDTTNMHKSHLFDLNCKICTGRMAPPTEEAGTKVVKVATTVVKRQSSSTEEALQSTSTTASALMDDLSLRAMEEGFLGFLPESRSDSLSMKEDTATFLTSLEKLWGGFVDMPAVARLLTKAYPVSGILDHLTQDLPDSIQVGGRISPSIVWDYVEKIRASGTKEICVIRLSPDTEEDEISYALLYAYFSSRKRYGVVANNRKQVKDMYLIPLGATEKIPHQIVPFDGPGLESNRPNLLIGLIIRHRSKRDFEVLLPSDASENPSFLAETKSQVDFIQNSPAVKDSEQRYISSLGVTHKKDSDLTKSTVEEPLLDTETDENVSLRFLPGVLNLSGNTPNDSVKKDHISSASNSGGSLTGIKPPTPISASRLERFVIKKKDSKMAKTVQAPSNSKPGSSSEEKEREQASPKQTVLSLSDKPADVSTEAFLSLLAASKPDQAASAKSFTTSHQPSEDTSEASKANDDSSSAPKNVSSGILKNAELLENNSSGGQVAQPSQKISEDKQVLPTIPLIGNEGVQPPCDPAPNPNVYNPPPAFHTAPRDTQDPVTPYVPLQPQVPLPFTFPTGPPPSIFPLTDPHALPPPWPPTVPPQTIPGLSLAYEASPMLSDSSGPSVSPSSKDPKSSEKSSSDSGSKSSKRLDDSGGKEDRDHYDRHHHKSKHYERERDKYRERSHSHKDRYSKDERYERHHGGHHYDKSKHRRDSERDRHRRDSDRRL